MYRRSTATVAVLAACWTMLFADVSGDDSISKDDPFAREAVAEEATAGVTRLSEPKPTSRSRTLAESTYQHLEERLSAKTAIRVSEVPLSDLLKQISEAHQIPIFPQRRVLQKAKVDMNAPVTIDVRSISLRMALTMILSKHDLDFIVKDELVQYTTKDQAIRQSITLRYHLPANRTADSASLIESLRRLLEQFHKEPMPQPAVQLKNAADGKDHSEVIVINGNSKMHALARDYLRKESHSDSR